MPISNRDLESAITDERVTREIATEDLKRKGGSEDLKRKVARLERQVSELYDLVADLERRLGEIEDQ